MLSVLAHPGHPHLDPRRQMDHDAP